MKKLGLGILLLSICILGLSSQTKPSVNPFIGAWIQVNQAAPANPETLTITEGISGLVVDYGDGRLFGAYILNGALICSGNLVSVIDSSGRLILFNDTIFTKQKK